MVRCIQKIVRLSFPKENLLYIISYVHCRENNSQANRYDTNTNESKHETVLLENKIDSLKLKDMKQSNNISNQYHYSQQSVKLDNQIQMIPLNGYNSQFPSASASLKIMGNENFFGEREQNKSEAEIPQTKDEITRGRFVVSEVRVLFQFRDRLFVHNILIVSEKKNISFLKIQVSTNPIEIGSILFSELPYSSVLLPEHYSTHCHHCYERLIAPIPCLKCTQPRYCSDSVSISIIMLDNDIGTFKLDPRIQRSAQKVTNIIILQCRQESWKIYHQYECTCLDLLHSVGIAHLSVRTVIVTGVENLISYRSTISKLQNHQKGQLSWLYP